MRRLTLLSSCTFVLASFVGCSSSSSRTAFEEEKNPAETPPPGSSGGFDDKSKPDAATTGADGCAEEARLVYVVSDGNDLFSFAPDKQDFQKIGRLECPSGGTPNSMAVDRSGTAWVNYSDGGLFKVSTKDASCSASGFRPGQSGFIRFGMAFASNSAGSQEETLYVAGIDDVSGGRGLATIDLQSLTLAPVGDYSGALRGKGAELTGTGEAKLFGFFTTTPYATLAQIDKASAATSSDKSLQGVSTGLAWAFSFWGGDFWFYTSDGVSPSKVTRLKTSTDSSISTVVNNVGFRIVGAGVSTCAPTSPR